MEKKVWKQRRVEVDYEIIDKPVNPEESLQCTEYYRENRKSQKGLHCMKSDKPALGLKYKENQAC